MDSGAVISRLKTTVSSPQFSWYDYRSAIVRFQKIFAQFLTGTKGFFAKVTVGLAQLLGVPVKARGELRWNQDGLRLSSTAHEIRTSLPRLLGFFIVLFFVAPLRARVPRLRARHRHPHQQRQTQWPPVGSGSRSIEAGFSMKAIFPSPSSPGNTLHITMPRRALPGVPRRRFSTIPRGRSSIFPMIGRSNSRSIRKPILNQGYRAARHGLVSANISGSTPPTMAGISNCSSTASSTHCHHLGQRRPRGSQCCGYTSSYIDITPFAKFGDRRQHNRDPGRCRRPGRVVVRRRRNLSPYLARQTRPRPHPDRWRIRQSRAQCRRQVVDPD